MAIYYYVYGIISSDIKQSSQELMKRPSSITCTITLCPWCGGGTCAKTKIFRFFKVFIPYHTSLGLAPLHFVTLNPPRWIFQHS